MAKSGLPKAATFSPTVEATTVGSATEFKISIKWQAPGENKDPNAKPHEYVTIVQVK